MWILVLGPSRKFQEQTRDFFGLDILKANLCKLITVRNATSESDWELNWFAYGLPSNNLVVEPN